MSTTPINVITPLQLRGVGRDDANLYSLMFNFNRVPTSDEQRVLWNLVSSWLKNAEQPLTLCSLGLARGQGLR